jgi:hypothetical protein
MRYPTACTSEFCGQFLCDGCPNRARHAAYYEAQGNLAQWEAHQAQLRADKAAGVGLFAPATSSA